MLTWFTQSSYIPFAMYQISNGGVFKHRSENSETVSLEEMRMMLAKVTETAEFYTRRFTDYMDFNSSLFQSTQAIKMAICTLIEMLILIHGYFKCIVRI